MNITRKALKQLDIWKKSNSRKPLIIRGARQVGKTTLVTMFSETYKQFIQLNLEKEKHRKYFEIDDVKQIVSRLFIENELRDDYENTLLFIDEIQESTKAIKLLRYFYEELPALHVIAAGSLLEFALSDVSSFPVGRVTYLYLHPFNFEEFLEANGKHRLIKELNKVPIDTVAHDSLQEQFGIYALIGGMPEVVLNYVQKKSIIDLPLIYESIWGTYKDDVKKYAKNSTEQKVIELILRTAPTYLDQRITFQHFGNSNYRSREVGEAFRRLDDAKLIRLIYPTVENTFPIKPDYRKKPRMQFLDTGLVNHDLGIQSELIGLDDMSKAFKGALIPHLVTQEFISTAHHTAEKPNFWVREKTQSSAEVDLVVNCNSKIVPIEVKSGKTGTLKSLHQFIDNSPHQFAVRMYAGKFSIENHTTPHGTKYLLMNLPYYLGTQLIKQIEYFINENS